MKLKVLLLIFAIIWCGSCSDLKTKLNVRNQTDKLNSSLIAYGADLRWGRYNYAYDYHVRRDGTKPQINLERLENFSVTSFTPTDPVLNAEANEAAIPIEIKYYDEQYGTIRTFKETQKWWFKTESKHWFIESDFPVLK